MNSPELCWTKMMSMAPLRVAVLMLAMLDTTPLKKFMAVYFASVQQDRRG